MSYKSGFVAIIGRPNVGKSTLLNKILGQKIVITSSKPQTTRRRIKGIFTSEKGQIIFVDTPGVHKPLYKLGEFLLEEAKMSIPEADLILFVVDGSEVAGRGDKWIVENLLNTETHVILALNKVDTIKSMEKRDEIVESYKALFKDKSVTNVKISAKTGRNVDDLVKNIYRKLPKGPAYYPEDEITDQNFKTIVAEMIREKIIRNTKEEVPHSIAVIIDYFREEEDITNIAANIFVEFESQKGIIIGENGSMLKKIGTEARQEVEKFLEKKVFLDLNVKLKKKWRKNPSVLKQFGYKNE
ncbi:MAG TPA: GTPase Era [Candidatus Gastranaerophilales bacterium]|nr:GTPase Era [Candidatus Gastranaerophilales bacterium]